MWRRLSNREHGPAKTLLRLNAAQESGKNVVDQPVNYGSVSVMPRQSDAEERLMNAAMDLIWGNSYGATSVDAICEKAGAKKGSFYHFFKSKSELAAAALEADWKKRKKDMDAVFSPTVPALDRLARYFDFVHDRLAEVQRKCGSVLGCPLFSL